MEQDLIRERYDLSMARIQEILTEETVYKVSGLPYFFINSTNPVSSPLKYCRYNSSSEIISCTSFPL